MATLAAVVSVPVIALAAGASVQAAARPGPAGASRATVAATTAYIQHLLGHPVDGTVNLPPGTFTVNPVLRLRQGLRIVGHHTVLRVASKSGGYQAMLTGATPATNLSGLTVTGVTFDQNARANPAGNTASLIHGKPRFVILVSAGSDITITGDRFVGVDDLNAVVTGGGTRNVTISGNVFRVTNRRGHDHSSIYTSGTGTVISNNHLTGTALFGSAAIEVHGGWVSVTGNYVAGYPRAVNIVASHATVTGNKVAGAQSPVDLWSVDSPGLRHVVVTGNTLGRNLRYWAYVYRQHGRSLPPAPYCRKIITDQTSTFPMRDITAQGNRG